jgi:hypothetical protein
MHLTAKQSSLYLVSLSSVVLVECTASGVKVHVRTFFPDGES